MKNMNNNLTYENIVKKTVEMFPEYKGTDDYENNDQDLQYSFFSGFTNYVKKKISETSEPENDELIKKYFDLFNEIIESNDHKLSELGVVEIIESLVQEKRSKEVTEKLFSEKSKNHLSKVLKYTGAK